MIDDACRRCEGKPTGVNFYRISSGLPDISAPFCDQHRPPELLENLPGSYDNYLPIIRVDAGSELHIEFEVMFHRISTMWSNHG